MARFTANISFLFADRPFLDRIAAVKAVGIDRVECHFPYEHPIELLKERLAQAQVTLTGINTAPGDQAAGEAGVAGIPGREAEFRRHLDQALEYATALGASTIHVMAGVIGEGDRRAALATYVANLRHAARTVAGSGVTLLLEPLNVRDRPGYLVSRSDEVARIIHEIAEPSVRMLFDVYHVQIMEGDLSRRLREYRDIIGHVQVAAVPTRAEPDEGEVSFSGILQALDDIRYAGLIGLEYRPRGSTEEGLRRIVGLWGT